MTGKHNNWHKAWRREPSGNLCHASGLRVLVTRGDGYTDLVADDATLSEYQRSELMRGVPLHDLLERLQRLLREATRWHEANP